jgi:hypothetical protein
MTAEVSRKVDAPNNTPKGAGVRFGEIEVAGVVQDSPCAAFDADTSAEMGMSTDAELTPPARGVAFDDSANVSASLDVSPGLSSGKMEKKKSQFSRFMKGEGLGGVGVTSPKYAARKTFANLQSKRKSMGATRNTSPEKCIATRKTLGVADAATFDLDDASDSEHGGTLAERPGNGERSDAVSMQAVPHGGSKCKRSRSLSRGPRRGRDRFRGVGAMFSTSKTRNAPRPPRATNNADIPAGTSSNVLLSLIRARRKGSPSRRRVSDTTSEQERLADLLKCRSADVGAVLRDPDI